MDPDARLFEVNSGSAAAVDSKANTTRVGWVERIRQLVCCWGLCLALAVGAPLPALAVPVQAKPVNATGDLGIDLNAKPRINPSIQAIRDSGVLIIGLAYPDNLPFYGHDSKGNLIGYDVDIARGMASTLKVKPVFSQPEVTYDRLIKLASADQVDIAFGKLSVTIPRLAYAEPVNYMNLRQSLLINRKTLNKLSPDQNNIGASLRNSSIRIGVISGSSHAVWGSTSFPKAQFKTYLTWQACVDALTHQDVDALFRDGFETSRLVKSNPRLALDYVPIILQDRIDNIAMFMGPRMQGLQPTAQLYMNITTGVVKEEDLFRQFSKEMRRSLISLAGKRTSDKLSDQQSATTTDNEP
ncbi:MAG: transporter substrate-binding domain-containing protein [Cyanobacteria bacterium K_DeepCast_35m_m2_023]|nr:transporter substrate-binding domain-containing protein [Cyanobacteria bacterium K_DeepCast_35m_m2_023]